MKGVSTNAEGFHFSRQALYTGDSSTLEWLENSCFCRLPYRWKVLWQEAKKLPIFYLAAFAFSLGRPNIPLRR